MNMQNINSLMLAFIFSVHIVPIHGDVERVYSGVLGEYERFMATLDTFRSSMDDVCQDLEEYENMKASLDTFVTSRNELCKNYRIRKDCASIKEEFSDATDGVYRIKPGDGKTSFLVYCDMTEHGGGWLVIQRRQDGSEDFYRTWFEYMDGFGNLTGEFWLGNEKIHRLTNQTNFELRVDLQNAAGKKVFAKYSRFRVGSMSEFYILSVSGYSGNASDSLTRHHRSRFSAKNLELDVATDRHCARTYSGAWWYKDCIDSNLNGLFNAKSYSGIWWRNFGNSKKTTMKIRPVQ